MTWIQYTLHPSIIKSSATKLFSYLMTLVCGLGMLQCYNGGGVLAGRLTVMG